MTIPFQQGQPPPPSLLDTLYCEEPIFEEEEQEEEEQCGPTLPVGLHQDEDVDADDELRSLFMKEGELGFLRCRDISGRREVVEWMLMVNNYYGFSPLTSVLSVDYLDRFLNSFHLCEDKPWSLHLAAVSCVSLAAKVEETFVPLLLDLQIEGTKYMFEAKNIQKMELLVLSTLEWKMHPVTSLSFVDHVIGRLGFNHHHHHSEFLTKCQTLLLSLLPDGRFVGKLPSILATATMMHVIEEIQPYNALDYHNNLFNILNINKEKVNQCYQQIKHLSSPPSPTTYGGGTTKRKREQMMAATNRDTTRCGSASPSGVIDASYMYLNYNGDSSNDSWATITTAATATTANAIRYDTDSDDDTGLSVSSSAGSVSLETRKKGRMIREEYQLQRVLLVDYGGASP